MDGYVWIVMVLFGIIILLLLSLAYAVGQIIKLNRHLSIEHELEEINRGRAAAEGFYDNVLEADITNNRLIGQNCSKLIQKLELPETATFTECIEKIIQLFVKEEYRELYRKSFDRDHLLKCFQSGENNFTMEFEERADLIHYYWTRVNVCIYYSDAAKAVKIISYVKNIQKEKEKEINLLNEATTDYLTGIYNKRATEKLCMKILEETKDQELMHALMIIDIDYFKKINDMIGHGGGDACLRTLADFLKKQFTSKDIVGRIGGDEFLILMTECSDQNVAKEKARELTQKVKEISFPDYPDITISFSVGIAIYPRHADHYIDLFNLADAALYEVKKHGRDNSHLWGINLNMTFGNTE